MRRKSVAAIILSCAMLCGCTFGGKQSGPINSNHGGNDDKPVVGEPSEVETPDLPDIGSIDDLPVFNGFGNEGGQKEFSMSYEDQIELIWNNISLWYGSFEGSDSYSTVVTDFDLNGRLEIIYQTRYGINSYYDIFEVNEAGDDLDIMNCEINSETMPDIFPGDIYAFAKDGDGNVIGFVMEDSWVERHDDGSMLVGAEKYFVTKNENDMQFEVISSYFIDYDSNMEIQTETFHYADGSDIEDREEWNDSGKTYISRTYPDAQIVYYSIGLQTYFAGVTDSELHDGLIESWEIWHEYNDPREYYDESYAAGEGEGEDAKSSNYIDENGSLTPMEIGIDSLLGTDWVAFEYYVFDINAYGDYRDDPNGVIANVNLLFDRTGNVTLILNGETFTGKVNFENEYDNYATVTFKSESSDDMYSVMHFYMFVYDNTYDEIEVIGMEFGEIYYYFWSVG